MGRGNGRWAVVVLALALAGCTTPADGDPTTGAATSDDATTASPTPTDDASTASPATAEVLDDGACSAELIAALDDLASSSDLQPGFGLDESLLPPEVVEQGCTLAARTPGADGDRDSWALAPAGSEAALERALDVLRFDPVPGAPGRWENEQIEADATVAPLPDVLALGDGDPGVLSDADAWLVVHLTIPD